MSFQLSKLYDPGDYEKELASKLEIVDQHFHAASPQHPARRWEYAMALRALWSAGNANGCLDVGGGGSPFSLMLPVPRNTTVVDPAGMGSKYTIQEFAATSEMQFGNVFCISVLEHVPDAEMDGFLDALAKVTAPGGLLFLTVDYAPKGPDTYHFHWMRERIYTPFTLGVLGGNLSRRGFKPLGRPNLEAPFHEIEPNWGYTFVSWAFIKEG